MSCYGMQSAQVDWAIQARWRLVGRCLGGLGGFGGGRFRGRWGRTIPGGCGCRLRCLRLRWRGRGCRWREGMLASVEPMRGSVRRVRWRSTARRVWRVGVVGECSGGAAADEFDGEFGGIRVGRWRAVSRVASAMVSSKTGADDRVRWRRAGRGRWSGGRAGRWRTRGWS